MFCQPPTRDSGTHCRRAYSSLRTRGGRRRAFWAVLYSCVPPVAVGPSAHSADAACGTRYLGKTLSARTPSLRVRCRAAAGADGCRCIVKTYGCRWRRLSPEWRCLHRWCWRPFCGQRRISTICFILSWLQTFCLQGPGSASHVREFETRASESHTGR